MAAARQARMCHYFICIIGVYLIFRVISLTLSPQLETDYKAANNVNHHGTRLSDVTSLKSVFYERAQGNIGNEFNKLKVHTTMKSIPYQRKVVDENTLILKTYKNMSNSKMSNQTAVRHPFNKFIYAVNGKAGECKVKFNWKLAKVDDWLPVDTMRSAFVYSAYHDFSTPDQITVTAITLRKLRLLCQFWYVDRSASGVTYGYTPAVIYANPESHGKRYTASVVRCPFEGKIPSYVSVVNQKCQTALNVVQVREIAQFEHVRNFTVCVTPLNFRYSKTDELIEWIELNRLLGAERFIFYNYSTSSNVDLILQHYIDQNLADVLKWSLPVKVDVWPQVKGYEPDVHYFGQLAALTDCVLRSKQYSTYIVNQDLDEFIIPYHKDILTWGDMISKLPKASWYSFRNVFFRKEWNDKDFVFPDMGNVKKYNLVTLLKTLREIHVFTSGHRSKYIARTDAVKKVGVHNVYNTYVGSSLDVHESIALLHHYRNWENYHDDKPRKRETIIADKYGRHLVENVLKIWSVVEGQLVGRVKT